jgi:hypothetical protein
LAARRSALLRLVTSMLRKGKEENQAKASH